MKSGKWEKKMYSGIELSGKTIGLIGCGIIGKLVAQKAFALGMKILIFNRSEVAIKNTEFEQVTVEKLYSNSDFISIHLPKSIKTESFIGADQFKLMKDNVRIINVSRGGIVIEKDLIDALESKIAGAAIDVYENEPHFNKQLVNHPKVIATPHIGAASIESQERVGVLIMDQVLEYLRSKYMFY
jgi:D-3-phosphoglycerate dehydrogenase